MRRLLFATSGATALLFSGAVLAQQATDQQPQGQVAEQCLQDLEQLNQEMVEAGYGAAGPPGYGLTTPEGGLFGTTGPRREMSALFAAAQVFARYGDQQACETVIDGMRQIYDERLAQLEEAGIPPAEVADWRQARLVEAQPVGELGRAVSVDNVVGADVRNLQDEDLGDIDDVVLDEQGNIAYVLVARGGFLGIGEELVPVRWQDLRALPDLDTFVLDVPEAAMEEAPTVDREAFASLEDYDQQRQQIDEFWTRQTG